MNLSSVDGTRNVGCRRGGFNLRTWDSAYVIKVPSLHFPFRQEAGSKKVRFCIDFAESKSQSFREQVLSLFSQNKEHFMPMLPFMLFVPGKHCL